MKFYLGGGVSHDADAKDWRQDLITALPMHEFWNPLAKELEVVSGADLAERFRQVKHEADVGYTTGLQWLRRTMLDHIIPLDIEGVTWADAIICRVKSGVRMYGSICEIYEAKWIQRKQVFLITDLRYTEMNAWEIALADTIWFSMDEAIEALGGE
jgi:hypothetical protein